MTWVSPGTDQNLLWSTEAGNTAAKQFIWTFKKFDGTSQWTFQMNTANSLIYTDAVNSLIRFILNVGGTTILAAGAGSDVEIGMVANSALLDSVWAMGRLPLVNNGPWMGAGLFTQSQPRLRLSRMAPSPMATITPG